MILLSPAEFLTCQRYHDRFTVRRPSSLSQWLPWGFPPI